MSHMQTPRGLNTSNMHLPARDQDDAYGSKFRFKNMMKLLNELHTSTNRSFRAQLRPWAEARQMDEARRPLEVLMVNIVSQEYPAKTIEGYQDSIGLSRLGVPPTEAMSCIFKFMNTHCRVCHVHGSSHQELVIHPH